MSWQPSWLRRALNDPIGSLAILILAAWCILFFMSAAMQLLINGSYSRYQSFRDATGIDFLLIGLSLLEAALAAYRGGAP